MQYYSTNNHKLKTDLKTAIFSGLAPDRGLFMPKTIKKLSTGTIDKFPKLSFKEIALEVLSVMFRENIPSSVLRKIVNKVFDFPCPLHCLHKNLYVLELFHGPTLSFKDFGARFMAELFSYFVKKSRQKITILTATSGDTGSAVAQAFYKKPNIRVVVLYPKNKISVIQEKQIATLGKNIIAIAVKGTFDDCQKLVKTALEDKELNKKLNLTSANSINIARLIPQTLYYFWIYAQLRRLSIVNRQSPIIISVPSGNLGNLTAGLIAKKMGLPIAKFIAAVNANDVIPQYLKTGKFNPLPSKQTLSNAMDVGNPSNLARTLALYNDDIKKMKYDITAISINNEKTKKTIKEIYQKYNYIIDPHTAVGFAAINKYRISDDKDHVLVVLSTAHPSKFPEIVEKIIGKKIKIPKQLQKYLKLKIKSVNMENDFKIFRKYLVQNPLEPTSKIILK